MQAVAVFSALFCAFSAYAAPGFTLAVDASQSAGKISPLLYGQFLEYMFEGVKGGLHAEMLHNRSFEEWPEPVRLPLDWSRYPDHRNDDYGLQIQPNQQDYYPPPLRTPHHPTGRSLRLIARRGVIARHGIFQSRVAVQAGKEYVASAWIHCTIGSKLTVSLEEDLPGGRALTQDAVHVEAGDWKQYSFRLKPNRTEPLGRFCILADAPFSADLDQISLMPAEAPDGVRPDVFAKIDELRPAFVRWPGGNVAQDYHWLWGVGPREQRLTWTNLSWNHELEPSDFGTVEFISFCRRLKSEPSITVNVEGNGATAEEAASWLEYCNGSVETRYGALRAAHGHPTPFKVKYWEIGNEIWGDWVRGHSDANTYASNLARYIRGMRKIDPGIKLVAVGDNNLDWNRTVLKAVGRDIDYLAIHHYYGWHEARSNVVDLLNRPAVYESLYAEMKRMTEELAPGNPLQLAINEWGLDLPEQMQYSIVSALYAGRMFNTFERSGGFIGMSAVSDLVNGWPGGIIQVARDRLFVSPIYLVNRLYAANTGTELIPCRISGGEESERLLDVAVSRSADGSHLYLHLVNLDLENDTQLQVLFSGPAPESTGTVFTVTSHDLNAANSFSSPDNVLIQTNTVAITKSFSMTLSKRSVSVWRVPLKKQ